MSEASTSAAEASGDELQAEVRELRRRLLLLARTVPLEQIPYVLGTASGDLLMAADTPWSMAIPHSTQTVPSDVEVELERAWKYLRRASGADEGRKRMDLMD